MWMCGGKEGVDVWGKGGFGCVGGKEGLEVG